MIKILTIIGARPQIIKAAALSRAIRNSQGRIKEIIVHTGQHYDDNMSSVFFEELGIPQPAYNLNVGSGDHGTQTARMIKGIEEILKKEKPECIILFGDTNSTLAGAIAASKMHVPVVHIEAGLRSFNKQMPEEINRIICDQVSTLLFTPTESGLKNLKDEGFKTGNSFPFHIDKPGIFQCGDIMYDNSLHFSIIAETKTDILYKYRLEKNNFVLVTTHRNTNTDDPQKLTAIFSALNKISINNDKKIILPLHPRTASVLDKKLPEELLKSLKSNINFIIIPPVSFLEMTALEKNASLIITDSGGVQKEAYFFKKCCVILREETEWTELVHGGYAVLAGANEEKIIQSYIQLSQKCPDSYPEYYGNGNASEFICKTIISNFS